MANSWPESTCVECGKRIPPGQSQRCEKGGFCSWHVPTAVFVRMEEMYEALQAIKGHLDADDLNSYRADDPEGAMDTAFERARAALTKVEGKSDA